MKRSSHLNRRPTLIASAFTAACLWIAPTGLAQDIRADAPPPAMQEGRPSSFTLHTLAGFSAANLQTGDDSDYTSLAAPTYGVLAQSQVLPNALGRVVLGAGVRGRVANQAIGVFKAKSRSITLNSLQAEVEGGLAQSMGQHWELQQTLSFRRGLWHESRRLADGDWQVQNIDHDQSLGMNLRVLRHLGPLSAGLEFAAHARQFDDQSGERQRMITGATNLLAGYRF